MIFSKLIFYFILHTLSTISYASAPSPSLFYPESPIQYQNKLIAVEYGASKVSIISKGRKTTFWQQNGCGPAAIARAYQNKGWIITCYDSNEIVLVNNQGKTTNKFPAKRPNDLVIQQNDLYYTSSGEFNLDINQEQNIGSVHKVNLLTLQDEILFKSKGYPNGITYINEQNLLLINFHFLNEIKAYNLNTNEEFIFAHITNNLSDDPYTGPDGIKYNKKTKTIFVAIYGAGKVLEFNLKGKLINSINTKYKYVTNLNFSKNNQLIVTEMNNANLSPYIGQINVYRIEKY